MKALILAAGIGKRLKVSLPKILLRIGNRSLLERHYDNLLSLGVKKIGIVVGYKSQYLIKCIKEIDKKKKIKIIKNPKYKLGSIVSLVSASSFFYERGELILMDGDVLYDKKILKKLIDTKKKDTLLIDKHFESGEEPVKVCIKNNKIYDFGKNVDNNFDFQGESVGFFKFSRNASFILLNESKKIMKNNRNAMYEDAIQKLIIDNEKVLALPIQSNESVIDVGTISSYKNALKTTFS